jgi:hypothetical protein
MAAEINVTGLVIICVSPTLINPPLVTVFVFVVCADTEAMHANNANHAKYLAMDRA